MSAIAVKDRAPVARPVERLESLCDPGSFAAVRTAVRSTRLGDRAGRATASSPAPGASAAGRSSATRRTRPSSADPWARCTPTRSCACSSWPATSGVPVVGFVESGGARLQEGHAALAGYGRIFRASVELSSRVPQISIVSGVSAGGGAYSPALTDFVVMTESARMFLTGPKIVEEALGEQVSMEDLGGPGVHSRNGVCQLVAADDRAAAGMARELLALLPSRFGGQPPIAPLAAPGDPEPGAPVPAEARKVYDVRDVAEALVDDGRLLELSAAGRANMVTALGRIEGRPVAFIANQPRRFGGVIDAAAAEKAALFVQSCDRFGMPLVVLVDTPGFMPGSGQERAGVIRHGASLLHAFAGARVPKLTVVLRKAYGGAVITMNSRDLGADIVFAWPGAEIGIMAARQAVGIVHGRRLAEANGDAADLHSELEDAYAAEHLNADAAAAAGFVDEVIEPRATRDRLAWALRSLEGR